MPPTRSTARGFARDRGAARRPCAGRAFRVPAAVAREAREGIAMVNNGYAGGRATGWLRAEQLAAPGARVDLATLRVMRAWFARHGPARRAGAGRASRGSAGASWGGAGLPRAGGENSAAFVVGDEPAIFGSAPDRATFVLLCAECRGAWRGAAGSPVPRRDTHTGPPAPGQAGSAGKI